MNETKFSKRLKAAIEEQGLTNEALAKKVNVSRATIGNYCEGSRQPNASILADIAEALNLSSDYLLGLSDKKSTVDYEKSSDIISALDSISEKLPQGSIKASVQYPEGENMYIALIINITGKDDIFAYYSDVEKVKKAFEGETRERMLRLLKEQFVKDN